MLQTAMLIAGCITALTGDTTYVMAAFLWWAAYQREMNLVKV